MLVYNCIIFISKERYRRGIRDEKRRGSMYTYVYKNSLIFLLLYVFFLYSSFAYLTL